MNTRGFHTINAGKGRNRNLLYSLCFCIVYLFVMLFQGPTWRGNQPPPPPIVVDWNPLKLELLYHPYMSNKYPLSKRLKPNVFQL